MSILHVGIIIAVVVVCGMFLSFVAKKYDK